MKTLKTLLLLALALAGFAFAQDLPKVGSFELDPTLSALVGAGLGIVISPLTALLKKWFKTEGITTQVVHFTLSLLIVAGIGYAKGAFGMGAQGIWAVLTALTTAFLTGIGSYTLQKQAAEGALKK